jgi:glutaredoxin
MPRVTLYAIADCPRCEEVRQLLRTLDVPFTEIDVTADPLALHRTMVFSGTPALPAVDVDGRVVVGVDRESLEELLAEQGKTVSSVADGLEH